ncbi:matrixin family metalloprotease [Kordiimonas sp. SCSIO 12603]|uniref:matrixin family metalloprotease n=1 Tax=Kordiimonas sp. SCSIO 12603 TaxID=2829596 RepID=UPI0021054C2F|nr:matrixin family metalloprotease [Kordiimonas sp. SCSIO 12603]UTW59771.1 matrixin family metalloprotease [Kordiimonas sp. SCSIO 12603]
MHNHNNGSCQTCGSSCGSSKFCSDDCKSSYDTSKNDTETTTLPADQVTTSDLLLINTGGSCQSCGDASGESNFCSDECASSFEAQASTNTETTNQASSSAQATTEDTQTAQMTAEASVTVGSSVTGIIGTEGEVDFISVVLEAGVTYQIDLEGTPTASGTLTDPLLTGIFFEDGVTRAAAANDDGGLVTNSRILFTPTVSGTYIIGASHFDNANQTDTGTYTLFVDTEENSTRPDQHQTNFTPRNGNNVVDGLTTSREFSEGDDGVTRITFSFPDEDAVFTEPFILEDDDAGTEIDLTETNVEASARAVEIFRNGLNFISEVANVEFQEIEEDGANFGVLRLSGNSADSGNVLGIASFPGRSNAAGDIFLFEDFIGSGTRLDFVTLHELGHALGLSHPSSEFPDQFFGAEFTLLVPSFQSAFFDGVTSADLFPTTFGYADILTLRHLYDGLDTAFSGDDTYVFDLSNRYFETIYDLGGTDTIQITGTGAGVDINLTPNQDFLGGAFINVGTTIRYFGGGQVVGTRTDTVFVSPETVIENIIASVEDDRIVGNTANNRIEGGEGEDTVQGADGNDRIRGDGGDDRLQGNAGNDFIVGGTGDDTVSAGEGDDEVFAGSGDTGNDLVVGESGNDILAGGGGNDLLVGGTFTGQVDGLVAFEDISSAAGSDTLFGGSGNDTLIGAKFDDADGDFIVDAGELVFSASSSNAIFAGTGDDQIYGDAGSDVLGGGIGDDTVLAGDGNDVIFGGRDTNGTTLNDVLNGEDGNDEIFASFGNDSVFGGAGNDTIFGGSGNDTIDGGSGDDDIFNSAGNDTVTGGSGDDTLRANAGDDQLTGGDGSDTFFFTAGGGQDTVTDFNVQEDILDLSNTSTDFLNLGAVTAASSETIVDGISGVLIDLGSGDTVFLQGITLESLNNVGFTF